MERVTEEGSHTVMVLHVKEGSTSWRATLREDLDSARRRDPAVRSDVELILGYPGLHAVWMHRLTHRMWQRPGLRVAARLLSLWTRTFTGIEIHPGAVI